MLHQPIPLRPAETTAALDLGRLAYHCMPLPSPSGRPRARVVLDKIKRQASALVKSPTRGVRSTSLTQDEGEARSRPVPTVTVASPSPSSSSSSIHLSSSGRPRSLSYSSSYVHHSTDETGLPTLPLFSSTSQVDTSAVSGKEFTPYLPFVLQLERSDGRSPSIMSSTQPIIPPPSPSTSEHSISVTSTPFPKTSGFPDLPHSITSASGVSDAERLMPSAFPPTTPNPKTSNVITSSVSEPFLKSKVQIVRRSPIKDSFLLACAAVDDRLPNERHDGTSVPKTVTKMWSGPLRATSTTTHGGKSKLRSNAPKKLPHLLPPLKPPPSCPLPSPPLTSPESDSEFSQLQSPTPSQSGRDDLQIPTSPPPPSSVRFDLGRAPCKVKETEPIFHPTVTVVDDSVEEWTLLLGSEPSKPLDWSFDATSPMPQENKTVKEEDDTPKHIAREDGKEDGRERRAGSVPPSKSKAFLIPPDDSTYTRMRTSSAVSGSTRRVVDGSAPLSSMFSNTSLIARTDVQTEKQEMQDDADWTLSLPVFHKSTCERGRRGGHQEVVKDEVVPREMRKCESWAEWTTTLGDAQEVEKARQKFKSEFSLVKLDWEKKLVFGQPKDGDLEVSLEREERGITLDKKTSQISFASASSAISASSMGTNTSASATGSIKISMQLKRQLPIGPTPPKSLLVSSKSNSSLTCLPAPTSIYGSLLPRSGMTSKTKATTSTGGEQGVRTSLKSSTSTSSLQSACSFNSSTSSLPGHSPSPIRSSTYLPLSINSHPYPSAVSDMGSDSGISTPASISISTLTTKFPLPPPLPSPNLSTFPSAHLGNHREARAPTLKDLSPASIQGSLRSSKSFEKCIPPSTTSSSTSSACSHFSISSKATNRSRSSVSSSATIKPSRPCATSGQNIYTHTYLSTSPVIETGNTEDGEADGESLRDSLDFVSEEGFDTCTEDGFTTVGDLDRESTISGAWYSARSSLDI